MKMNGLDSKHYWINFFIVSFILSTITSLNMFIFGKYIIDIDFFKLTSAVLLWTVFIGWTIAQISMTSLIQIFITNSKSATIVGYLLSIFSTIIGQVITTLIYPLPFVMPRGLLLYPPFALSRIIYMIGWACSDISGCYQSITGIHYELGLSILILYGWLGIFLLSIWLNEMVQQEYGVAKMPKCLTLCRKRSDSGRLVE